jgi:hypothetical protein
MAVTSDDYRQVTLAVKNESKWLREFVRIGCEIRLSRRLPADQSGELRNVKNFAVERCED